MKRLLLAFSLFITTPGFAGEITSRITDSVQLTVQGAAVQTERIGSSYAVGGANIGVSALGGLRHQVNKNPRAWQGNGDTRGIS